MPIESQTVHAETTQNLSQTGHKSDKASAVNGQAAQERSIR